MEPQAQPAMRRTPPSGPPVTVGIAEPDEPMEAWLKRLARQLAALVRQRRQLRRRSRHL